MIQRLRDWINVPLTFLLQTNSLIVKTTENLAGLAKTIVSLAKSMARLAEVVQTHDAAIKLLLMLNEDQLTKKLKQLDSHVEDVAEKQDRKDIN